MDPPLADSSVDITSARAAHSLLALWAGSDGVIHVSSPPRVIRNSLLPPTDYARLAPLTIPRDRWVLGYESRVRRTAAEVEPWSAVTLSQISVAELDLAQLVRHFLGRSRS